MLVFSLRPKTCKFHELEVYSRHECGLRVALCVRMETAQDKWVYIMDGYHLLCQNYKLVKSGPACSCAAFVCCVFPGV